MVIFVYLVIKQSDLLHSVHEMEYIINETMIWAQLFKASLA